MYKIIYNELSCKIIHLSKQLELSHFYSINLRTQMTLELQKLIEQRNVVLKMMQNIP